jgi:serine/threonine protein kinase
MGVVYRARDRRLGREVAIKVLPDKLAENREALARLEREAQAVAALSHPNIVAIFDMGTEGGISYLVTELLEGETLRARLAHGPLPWHLAAEIAAALAEGLAVAHARGIVHRDLKPTNVFLTRDGRVRILDFGLALVSRAGENTVTELTQEGAVVGTVGYMSPEQIRAEAVGPASDIFSLGCVLYEMMSGRKAFQGRTAVEIASAILRDTPPGPASLGIQAPAEFDRLIQRCLQKDAGQRPGSAEDLSRELKAMGRDGRGPAHCL